MGLRFQKRITLFKGFIMNLSKTGASVSVGPWSKTKHTRR
ncbi:DUF4236 domain-containing protein [Polynucleobacter sp. UK-Gri1-W3]|nr:DUF4236 domain-containing protein [Polynucleobacter sp. UK-Gri1-W3]